MEVIIAYDISVIDGESRRRRVADICHAYGHRVQQSVFECRVSPTRYALMVNALREVIDYSLDTIAIYAIPGKLEDSRTVLGREHQYQRAGSAPWLV